jgi:hypothetical protein
VWDEMDYRINVCHISRGSSARLCGNFSDNWVVLIAA